MTRPKTANAERQGYASRRDVAEYMGLPVSTLGHWAARKTGPTFVKIGRHTRYRWADVDAWIAAQQQGGAAAS